MKGSIDPKIVPLCDIINHHPNYVTTSSCSGRVYVYNRINNPALGAKERWIYVSHDITPDPSATATDIHTNLQQLTLLNASLSTNNSPHTKLQLLTPQTSTTNSNPTFPTKNTSRPNGILEDELSQDPNQQQTISEGVQMVAFGFAPFIVHVEARDYTSARLLFNSAIQAGLRSSGLLPGKDRFMVTIQSTLVVDSPLWVNGEIVCDQKYTQVLLEVANKYFIENENKLEQYTNSLKKVLSYLL